MQSITAAGGVWGHFPRIYQTDFKMTEKYLMKNLYHVLKNHHKNLWLHTLECKTVSQVPQGRAVTAI